ncbi:sulfotransferase family 2 domain-containing protein [Halomonas sp. HG01]|uniref:sulfotransferase family 2 domain-containing protein n=1 Tax=Halomonas sp. HG01 TaxID=1609967 RepID=UPI0009E25BE5|nr:sulfotransferase family 2 domain-containing protein [Halomonas sp. HG01]
MGLKEFLDSYRENKKVKSSFFSNVPMLYVEKRYIEQSLKRGWIFLHVPKCAGTSLKKTLDISFNGHPLYRDIESYKPSVKGIKKVSVVRDPAERLVSAYNHIRKGNGVNAYMDSLVLSRFKDINDFIDQWLNEETIYLWPHFIPQYEFLLDNNHEIAMDKIFKVERLSQSIGEIEKTCGVNVSSLSVKNPSSGVSLEMLSGGSLDKIKSLYKKDYVDFDYL